MQGNLAESPTSRVYELPCSGQHSQSSTRRSECCKTCQYHRLEPRYSAMYPQRARANNLEATMGPWQNRLPQEVPSHPAKASITQYTSFAENHSVDPRSLCRSNLQKLLPREGPSQPAQTSIGTLTRSPTSRGPEPTANHTIND